MKTMMIAAPMALLLASVTFAQTSGSQKEGSGQQYGAEWPDSVTSTFMTTDGTTMTMRAKADIAASWVALSQAERDAVVADCETYKAEAGGAGAQGDGSAAAGAGATGAAADVAADAGFSGAEMAQVCEAIVGM